MTTSTRQKNTPNSPQRDTARHAPVTGIRNPKNHGHTHTDNQKIGLRGGAETASHIDKSSKETRRRIVDGFTALRHSLR